MKIADRCRTPYKLEPGLILCAPPRLYQYFNGFTGDIKRLSIEAVLGRFSQLLHVADSQELDGLDLNAAFQIPLQGLRRVIARHTKQPDVEMGQTSSEGVGAEPWRYIGYPGFVSFMASDPELLVIRRFDGFHTRALLIKQDQVSGLEERLKELDEK